MSNQRAIKKQLMKCKSIGFKKVEHFFSKGKKVGTRITSMIGKYKFINIPGRKCHYENP